MPPSQFLLHLALVRTFAVLDFLPARLSRSVLPPLVAGA